MMDIDVVRSPVGADWTAAEVLQWSEQFRQMMLATHAEPGMSPAQVYDKIRLNDPSRQVAATER